MADDWEKDWQKVQEVWASMDEAERQKVREAMERTYAALRQAADEDDAFRGVRHPDDIAYARGYADGRVAALTEAAAAIRPRVPRAVGRTQDVTVEVLHNAADRLDTRAARLREEAGS
ncbi:hypothetical protein MF406_14285 [Georgenia sp. TF02-10]|uniref:hypothetical protein n=1 Tax=Georgenia sp. TF02-10 TaxID=2917725 RepID=UPI001FA7211F|nr:hypothetical protein [Georgenia sp. TF02-10]UNX54100.1 hypothetical protein MF406_14285 [Georgenia sp. TF02-10]